MKTITQSAWKYNYSKAREMGQGIAFMGLTPYGLHNLRHKDLEFRPLIWTI